MVRSVILLLIFTFVSTPNAQSPGYNFVCASVDQTDCSKATQIAVCATNGIRYPSECEFIKAHCKDVNLDVSKTDNCGNTTMATIPTMTTPNTNVNITTTTATVTSGSNSSDVTTTAAMVNTTTPTLSLLCQVVVTTTCPPDNSPLCGSDYNQYSSLCEFTKAQCYDNSLTVLNSGACPLTTPQPTMAFDIICGFLQTMTCTDDGSVVCASDGNTFNNTPNEPGLIPVSVAFSGTDDTRFIENDHPLDRTLVYRRLYFPQPVLELIYT